MIPKGPNHVMQSASALARQLGRACHDTLQWLISFSLGLNVRRLTDSISIAKRIETARLCAEVLLRMEQQNSMLTNLQLWVAGYYSRDDWWSYKVHRKIFDAHTGPKVEYTVVPLEATAA
jgi:hypothetical protein